LLKSVDGKGSTFLHVAVENNSVCIISICQTIEQRVLNAADREGYTALGLACRDLKCEAGQALVNAGVNVDKLSCDRHPAYLAGKALSDLETFDAVTLENVTAMIDYILKKSTVDHMADEYISRDTISRVSGIALN
jgi:hypothetical protein